MSDYCRGAASIRARAPARRLPVHHAVLGLPWTALERAAWQSANGLPAREISTGRMPASAPRSARAPSISGPRSPPASICDVAHRQPVRGALPAIHPAPNPKLGSWSASFEAPLNQTRRTMTKLTEDPRRLFRRRPRARRRPGLRLGHAARGSGSERRRAPAPAGGAQRRQSRRPPPRPENPERFVRIAAFTWSKAVPGSPSRPTSRSRARCLSRSRRSRSPALSSPAAASRSTAAAARSPRSCRPTAASRSRRSTSARSIRTPAAPAAAGRCHPGIGRWQAVSARRRVAFILRGNWAAPSAGQRHAETRRSAAALT